MRRVRVLGALVAALAVVPAGATECADARDQPLLPADPARCDELAEVVQHPSAIPLEQYEARLGEFLRGWCHRRPEAGWERDRSLRATGPFHADFDGAKWVGHANGVHAPVVIWYSPEAMRWLRTERGSKGKEAKEKGSTEAPVPGGAILVKEMFTAPADRCRSVEPERLFPSSGAAVMVRDPGGSYDGWFWGWFGWPGGGNEWAPDFPAGAGNPLPLMGFGQYCTNCHASAVANLTFASLDNVAGEPGVAIPYLSQSFADVEPPTVHHSAVPADDRPDARVSARKDYDPAFRAAFPAPALARPTADTVDRMPSQTYDTVWVGAAGPGVAATMLTSDQCLGCHDAGGTGLTFDMTRPDPHGMDLLNLSPYGSWRSSPMGLGGRDPIFFAQLASETQSFHPQISETVQDACLGCHGVQGQRQYRIDTQRPDGRCEPFLRTAVDAVPWPDDAPDRALAPYGALARDGIACAACHRMLVGRGPEDPAAGRPENHCVVSERQPFFNPDETGFAKTFTGSFLLGPPDELYGPFEDPVTLSMETALGSTPVHDAEVSSSELCGSCHTVHLPVYRNGELLDRIYEQTTYPEWAFSDFRVGWTLAGDLPSGAGATPRSCQSCHMPNADADGNPSRSKIAGIQETGIFPATTFALGAEETALSVREGFSRHTLVGLNYFLVAMAEQLPEVLGLRATDPMLGSKGLDPVLFTQRKIVDQARSDTVALALGDITATGGKLVVPVTLTNLVGHKFPSGVGFRRAFVELEVLDADGGTLWASGRTNGTGMIVGPDGAPIAGELWWEDDCSSRLAPGRQPHQPHYEVITRPDQTQIYQELSAGPAPVDDPRCGADAVPGGELTTSFLSICRTVKDNRLLPSGFLDLDRRAEIAEALGAKRDLAVEAGPHVVGDDPDYVHGGGDSYRYEVDLDDLGGTPAMVRAAVFYQATPPFYLQDRFCTARGADTERLYYLAGHLDLDETPAESWKLELVRAEAAVAPTVVRRP